MLVPLRQLGSSSDATRISANWPVWARTRRGLRERRRHSDATRRSDDPWLACDSSARLEAPPQGVAAAPARGARQAECAPHPSRQAGGRGGRAGENGQAGG